MMTFYLNERFVVFIVFVLINLVFRLWSFYEYFKNISCQVKKRKKKEPQAELPPKKTRLERSWI